MHLSIRSKWFINLDDHDLEDDVDFKFQLFSFYISYRYGYAEITFFNFGFYFSW